MPQGDWTTALNDAQRCAVEHRGGPLVVLAGPGTGKTRTIIARMRRLIEDGADPDSILVLTFGIKAAEEIRERLADQLGQRIAENIRAYTFHGFGRSLLQRFSDLAGIRPDPTIMDSAQHVRLLRTLIRAQGLFPEHAAAGYEQAITDARTFIADCRHAGLAPTRVLDNARHRLERCASPPAGKTPDEVAAERYEARRFHEHARLFGLFEQACRQRGLITFEEFISIPIELVRRHDWIGPVLRAEIKHVLVDEFQDVNAAQIELIRIVAPPSTGIGPDLCVVGDDDQAIYAFRGADTRAFERFALIWPDHETVALKENYRSAPPVVDAANKIILEANARFAGNKSLVSAGDAARLQGSIEGLIVEQDEQAGVAIAAAILADRKAHPGRPWNSYCVLARTNNYLDDIAAILRQCGVRVTTPSRDDPAKDPAVKDLFAWLRLLTNPADASSASRLLIRPPISTPLSLSRAWRRTHERAEAAGEPLGFADWIEREHAADPVAAPFISTYASLRNAAAHEPADQIIERVIREASLSTAEALEPLERARRIEHLVSVIRFARRVQPHLDEPGDLRAFLSYYDDLEESEQSFAERRSDELDASREEQIEPDAVRLITAHRAKGLEFDTVFVARVRPGHGFPQSDRDKNHTPVELPAELAGAAPGLHADEERRLFYVACTRAKRRLVLVAKKKQSRGKAVDYYEELFDHAQALGAVEHHASHWIELAQLKPPDPVEEFLDIELPASQAGPALIRRELNRLRQDAVSILLDVERQGDPHGAVTSLASCAASVDALATLGRTGALPDPLPSGADEARLRALAERWLEVSAPRRAQGMSAPLELSYSSIRAYLDCPRCFYVKYILGLDEPKTDQLAIGDVVHKAIDQCLKEMGKAEEEGREFDHRARLLALGGEQYRASWPASKPYSEAGLEQVRALLINYFDMFVTPDVHTHLQSFEAEADFDYGNEGTASHRIKARVDRFDRMSDNAWRIVDYKTGRATKSLLSPEPDDLQLCIYRMALPALLSMGDGPPEPLRDDTPGRAEYWLLATGERGVLDFKHMKLDKARRKIDQAIKGMLEGDWTKGRNCRGFCDILGDIDR